VPQATEDWQAFADSVAAQVGRDAVLVGHSGAGPLLPQIRERAGRITDALVFVDAGVPPEVGEADLMPDEILAELRPMTTDGMLPPWSDWFGPGVMQELIPERRAIVSGELPRLPLSYFEDSVPMPAGWARSKCGFVQLSDPYAADAAQAARRGWPVLRRPGAHLDIVTRPALLADTIVTVTGLLGVLSA
jgi:hypothetical protein